MITIDREDMLELTRRMTVKRHCFSRIAGAYMDEEGFVDGTFNTHFLNLTTKEKETYLSIAKAIPFAPTNENLTPCRFEKKDMGKDSVWQCLMALNGCELKNDALLDVFYEFFGEHYQSAHPYAIYFFHGSYDVPMKAKDKANLWESEEVFKFMICAICPIHGDYEPGLPECGFMFPAFTDRSADIGHAFIYQADTYHPHKELISEILWKQN